MERLGYGRERDYGDEDDYGHGGSEQVRGQQDGHGEEYRHWHDDEFDDNDFGNDDLDDDDEEVQDFTGAAEYLAYYAADTGAQTDALVARFGWRGRARGGRRGKGWTPPNTREHSTPVFVRVENLRRRDADSPADQPSGPPG